MMVKNHEVERLRDTVRPEFAHVVVVAVVEKVDGRSCHEIRSAIAAKTFVNQLVDFSHRFVVAVAVGPGNLGAV